MTYFRDISERKRIEEEREKLIHQLQGALANVKTLGGLLPICASCKKIRDDEALPPYPPPYPGFDEVGIGDAVWMKLVDESPR